jgi:hypothetical protein
MGDNVTPEVAFYVYSHYRHLMTPAESRANRHLVTTHKATVGRSDVQAQAEVRAKGGPRAKWLSDEPEVLTLAADGLAAFQMRVALRILDQHPGEVVLNYCPRCRALARTPKAKWCPNCGHDWH